MPGRIDKLLPPQEPNTGLDSENAALEVLNRELEGVDEKEIVGPIVEGLTDDDARKYFETLLKEVREEDKDVRDEQIAIWKRLEYYWNNVLDIFYDEVSRDWRIPTDEEWDEIEQQTPRAVNIFRPHGEAIVAALSVTIPNLVFYPDDAENPDDLEFARAARNISELLSRHNDGPILFIRAIVVMLLQGTIFGYSYYKEDEKYGSVDRPKVTYRNAKTVEVYCENCGEPLDGLIDSKPEPMYECQNCGYAGQGIVKSQDEVLPQIVGFTSAPKSSICQEIFSPLYVKIPMNAKKQEECGYLLLEFQQSIAMLRDIFPEKANKIDSSTHSADNLSSYPTYYRENVPKNTARVSALWVRPWQFWLLGANDEDVDKVKKLKAAFPGGCYAIFINDELYEVSEERMDEHWTISKNPLGTSLTARPLAENLANVQDLRAELTELEMQTVEHGIPETFADPQVLDFNKYGEGRSKPGTVTAAKPRGGKDLSSAFYTTKTAILSQEVDPLRQRFDQDGQFVMGSFPSVYGGPAEGGSKTASEYAQSKSMALQRLGTTYKILCDFWSDFQARGVIEYANILKEEQRDEKFVKKEGQSFVNQWIRFTSLSGRIGRIEPESSDQLPTSWAQKRDVIFQFLQSGVPEIMQLMIHPRNIELVKSATGLQDVYIPGEDARNKQLREFNMMSQGIPVPVNPELDNHQIHAEILRGLLEGIAGESLGPEEKQICLMHLNEHQMIISQQMMAQQAEMNQAQPPEKGRGVKQNA